MRYLLAKFVLDTDKVVELCSPEARINLVVPGRWLI
jgi:hypothetical protein